MRTYLLSLATIVWAVALAAPASADISLLSSTLSVTARDGLDVSGNSLNPSSLPFSASHTVAAGVASSRTTYAFSASGDTGLFSFGFDHVRAGVNSFVTGQGELRFSVTNDLLYSFDGISNLTGGKSIFQGVRLEDVGTGEVLFRNEQQSLFTTNESFTLGQLGGDTVNLLFGSISGTLTAGHTYELIYNYNIQAFAGPDGGATAVGNFNMNLNPIPAPGAALLGMMGLGLVGWFRRRLA